MKKPYLIIVTGEPGSGKTTFAEVLSRAAHLPLLSRDAVKEGLVHTWEREGTQPDNPNLAATELFFDLIGKMADGGCSLIAEAAFQHRVWSRFLTPLMDRADIRVCICAPATRELARERYIARGLADADRVRFHGDPGVENARRGERTPLPDYEAPHLPVPTYRVDTTGEYVPPIAEMIPLLLAQE